VVVVVVVVVTQLPSAVGFVALKSIAPVLVIWLPGPNCTLYVSPPFRPSSTQPSKPGSGGSTVIDPRLPSATALRTILPRDDFLICALLRGPFSPFESLYLKPFVASPLQKGLPASALVPAGRANVCALGVPPFATNKRLAPATVGSPTMVSGLATSFALTTTFRFSGVLGFVTTSWEPRMVWSAARAGGAAVTARASTRPTQVVRLRSMGGVLQSVRRRWS